MQQMGEMECAQMNISLAQVCQVSDPQQFKMHLACWNGYNQPLDVFVRDRKEWDGWNSWRGKRNDFSRDYIFSLIDFYPQKDTWLFGGVYRVIERKPVDNSHSYTIEAVPDYESLTGRLKITLKRPGRAKAVNFDKHYGALVVAEILPEPYSGEAFCGYDRIDIGFSMLENLISRQRTDWKTALANAKGVYLITDTENGKRYVGSAYGNSGIWSRWECYAGTGHGYNDELTKLIKQNGLEYARQNFRFAVLEYCGMKTDDQAVIAREQYWKQVLLSRGQYGYNKN
ncbi:GIY-YIG nuclease family protein [Prosthecochloris sp. ZM]|uniref:GIY-YIG nuclease family protein n=1 Tax=Prosthecochloris sp. ZM TaxID=2283143 RepID=UPI001FC98477|nr:GIY-YIG nuclease family protein [Prosthecochloris sp. ZM]